MSADSKKQSAAAAALAYVPDHEVLGVGTGSTVNFFIDALAARKVPIKGAVSSSESSTARLKQHGIEPRRTHTTPAVGRGFGGDARGCLQ